MLLMVVVDIHLLQPYPLDKLVLVLLQLEHPLSMPLVLLLESRFLIVELVITNHLYQAFSLHLLHYLLNRIQYLLTLEIKALLLDLELKVLLPVLIRV